VSLAQREAWFWLGVRSPRPPSDIASVIASRAGLSASRRLGLYRSAYFARQFTVLEQTYPRTAAAQGAASFRELVDAYLVERPSRAPAIEWIGAGFADFLRRAAPQANGANERLANLAELEWARHRALLAPNPAQCLAPEELARRLVADARLVLAPSLSLLCVTRDTAALWERPELSGHDDSVPLNFAVWRRGFVATHTSVASDEAAALSTAMRSATFDEICSSFAEPGGLERASAAIARWIRSRWIVSLVALVLALSTLGCANESAPELGFETGPSMMPGEDCSRCHWPGSDYPTAPHFTAAGTVFPAPDAPATSGVSGVMVELRDPGGSLLETLHTNSVGNFYTTAPLPDGFRVALAHGGQRVEMPCPPPAGNCGACHSLPPIGQTQGRIYAPGGGAPLEPPLDCESWTRSAR
jgi:hypothetical protein